MRDGFVLGDGAVLKLECGHPNKNEGEWCENCGQQVPIKPQPEESENGPVQEIH